VKRLVFLTAAVLAPLACSVGSGSGSAKGSLFVFSCRDTSPNGDVPDPTQPTVVLPIFYNLGPDPNHPPEFFAGVPIEDQVQGPGANNQIEFRMQSTGLVQLYTDILEFDVNY